MQLLPYLIFNGSCKDAMEYYSSILNGTITKMQTYEESPLDAPEEANNRIFDSELTAGEVTIKASDSFLGQDVEMGKNISLFLVFDDPVTQKHVYEKLGNEGNISFDLNEQSGFAMLTDKFGISWMLAYSK